MATVLKAGSVSTELKANPTNLINGFKSASGAVKDFGREEDNVTSKTKRLQDQLADLQRRKKTLSQQLDETKGKYGENSVQVLKLQDRLANLNDRIDTQKLKLGEVGDASIKMGDDFEKAGTGMQAVAVAVGTFIGDVLADAFRSASTAIADFTKDSFASAMETEKQGIAFRVLTGSLENSKKMMEDINKMAVRTPFDIADLRDLTKQMLSFGFAQEEIIPNLEMLGDITAGTGGDLKLLGRAYGQIKTKGKLYAQEINQLGEQGVGIREALAESMGITTEELMIGMDNRSISVGFDQFERVMQDLHASKFDGLMDELADSAAGRMQNLGETISLVGQEIIGIDTVTSQIRAGSIFDMITRSLEKMIGVLDAHKDTIIGFFSNIEKAFTWIIDNKEIMKAVLAAIAGAIAGLAIAVGAFIFFLAGPAVAALGAFIMAAWPFVLVGALIGAAIYGIYWAIMNWATVTTWFSNIWAQTTNFLADFWWGRAIMKAFDIWLAHITWIFNMVAEVALWAWDQIVTGFNWVKDKITGVVSIIRSSMERGFGYAFGTVVALLWVWVSQTMPRIFMSLLDLIKGVQSKISESIIAGFTRFIDWVKTQDWKQIGTDIINGIIQGIQNGASALSDTLSNVASEALQGFKDTLKIQSPSRVMFEVGVNIMEGLDLGIEDQMGVIENRVNIVADGMIDQFSNMQPRNNNRGGLTINQYGADINTTWIPSYAR